MCILGAVYDNFHFTYFEVEYLKGERGMYIHSIKLGIHYSKIAKLRIYDPNGNSKAMSSAGHLGQEIGSNIITMLPSVIEGKLPQKLPDWKLHKGSWHLLFVLT